MIVVIVRHFVREGRYQAAKARIAGNTDRILAQPGILFRHTGDAVGEAEEIVTVTGWRTSADRDAWDAVRKAEPPQGNLSEFYTGYETREIEIFDARVAQGGPGAVQQVAAS